MENNMLKKLIAVTLSLPLAVAIAIFLAALLLAGCKPVAPVETVVYGIRVETGAQPVYHFPCAEGGELSWYDPTMTATFRDNFCKKLNEVK